MVDCLNYARWPGGGDILYTLSCFTLEYISGNGTQRGATHSIYFLLFILFIHIGIQAGGISPNGVSTTDTGIAFRKISK